MARAIHHFLFIAALSACAAGCGTAPNKSIPAAEEPLVITGPTMGTEYTIKLFNVSQNLTEAELKSGIESMLDKINDAMSTWQDDSELSRFNHSGSSDWFEVSPDTAEVVAEAIRVHETTDGAFDVTVNPLLKLWGFGPYDRPEYVPTAEEIAAVQIDVGCENIKVRRDPPALRKSRPKVQIVLSGIAKGFAVDRVVEWLDEQGVSACLVEIGGEVRAHGTKPDGQPWVIGIEKPTPGERSVQKVVELSNRAMATSGDYRNYYEQDGRRYSHTIDPRSGKPIAHRLAAVSVVADSCMTADAVATALMVLGPDEGYNLAVERDWAAYLIIRDGDRFIEKQTPRFRALTELQRDGK
jgi:thiamine biosynthesis lipoprotein